MSRHPARILLLFFDGLGLGPGDPSINPFAAAPLPFLSELLAGRRLVEADVDARGVVWSGRAAVIAVDARLGIAGMPQSGTGQTALLTGLNAAALYGRHFGPWVPTPLRERLRLENVLARAAAMGRAVAFANAHPPGARLDRRPAGPALAADSVGGLWRGAEELRSGRAVASSITNERWIAHLPEAALPSVPPETAARNLACITAAADLTLFAHYDTDFVGHRGSLAEAVALLERIDRFFAGLFEHLPPDTLVVLASDHGNLEDVRAGHTRNPVPVLVSGPGGAELADGLQSITDLAPRLLRLLHAE